MKKLFGHLLVKFPFINLERIGALLYHEFPSTVVYADEFNNIIIVEWVDFNDDNRLDKFIAYEVTKNNLQKFVDGLISHHDFIKNAKHNFIVSFDGKIGFEKNFRVVFFDDLPKDYLPTKDIFFEIEEGVEVDKVTHFFKLKVPKDRQFEHSILKNKERPIYAPEEVTLHSLLTPEIPKKSQIEILENLAKQEQSEVINLHLKEGQYVGYGSVETHILGEVLTKFDSLYREAALDHYEGVNRDNLRSLNTKRGKILYRKITTEVVLTQAASYSLFIRPSSKNLEEINNSPISQSIFSLFSISNDLSSLSAVKDNYSVFVYKSYEEFLDVIKDSKIEIQCNLYNPFEESLTESKFEANQASKLLENIKELIQIENHKFKLVIRFDAINCNTRHYSFTLNDEFYSGHFDKQIKESMKSLSFTKYYQVTVARKIELIAGSSDTKITDTIISCIEAEG